ncbi:MAG TPA: signal peptidase II, partial [Chloroflexota bacterium]|nr:signal peptidase II [Chloroflexota bacterium]
RDRETREYQLKLSVPMPRGGRLRIHPGVLLTALVVLVLDQASKLWIVQTIGQVDGPHSVQVVGDFVRLSYTTNTGAAFGMFPAGTLFFTVVALIAVPVILLARSYVDENAKWLTIVFGMMMGGALGNLLDRIRLHHVVDFIDVGVGNVRWWSFNVADSSFVVGVILLALYLSFKTEPAAEPRDDRQRAV